jgi:hypothetical protein
MTRSTAEFSENWLSSRSLAARDNLLSRIEPRGKGNRLCVDLDYMDDEGRRSTRIIEPYSLRQTRAGEIVLHGVHADVQEHRPYRVDRIRGANVTTRIFAPRYAIELTPTGPLTVSETAGRTGISAAWREPISRAAHSRRTAERGPVYIYRCPVCDKRYEWKTFNAALNPHRIREGYPCYGRMGVYQETKW